MVRGGDLTPHGCPRCRLARGTLVRARPCTPIPGSAVAPPPVIPRPPPHWSYSVAPVPASPLTITVPSSRVPPRPPLPLAPPPVLPVDPGLCYPLAPLHDGNARVPPVTGSHLASPPWLPCGTCPGLPRGAHRRGIPRVPPPPRGSPLTSLTGIPPRPTVPDSPVSPRSARAPPPWPPTRARLPRVCPIRARPWPSAPT